jgi:hypothetical protein
MTSPPASQLCKAVLTGSVRGRASDPIRTVRGTGYSFDERFGKEELSRVG